MAPRWKECSICYASGEDFSPPPKGFPNDICWSCAMRELRWGGEESEEDEDEE